jgi:hypothetical protein
MPLLAWTLQAFWSFSQEDCLGTDRLERGRLAHIGNRGAGETPALQKRHLAIPLVVPGWFAIVGRRRDNSGEWRVREVW